MKGRIDKLECSDGSFYTESTIDLQRQLIRHSTTVGS